MCRMRTTLTVSFLSLLLPLMLMAQDLTVDQVIDLHKGGIAEAYLSPKTGRKEIHAFAGRNAQTDAG